MTTTRITIVREPYLDDVPVRVVGGLLKRLLFALRLCTKIVVGVAEIRL